MAECFEKCAERVRRIKRRPTDEELLQLYGLYKQATEGDIKAERPKFWDFKSKAKFQAWSSRKGLPQADAKRQYCVVAEEMIAKYS